MAPTDHFWGAERFQLDRSRLYRELSEEKKHLVLGLMTRFIFTQGATIEKTGISYAAKMVLLSDSLEEKSLYAGFANDEAMHLREFQNFFDADFDRTELKQNPLFRVLLDAIQNGSRSFCYAFIQILLEGYGMHFYNDLKDECLDPEIQQLLVRILRDEAVHHGSGLILSESAPLSGPEQGLLRELFHGFTVSAQCWALPIVQSMELVTGHLNREQKASLLSDIGMEAKTAQRLQGLRALVAHGNLLAQMGEPWISGAPAPFTIDQVLACQTPTGG